MTNDGDRSATVAILMETPALDFYDLPDAMLGDPAAVAAARAVSKYKCGFTLRTTAYRLGPCVEQSQRLGLTSEVAVIAVVCLDDIYGGPLEDVFADDVDFEVVRAVAEPAGKMPVLYGLMSRPCVQKLLEAFDVDAADKLRPMTELAVVLFDHGVAEVYVASEIPTAVTRNQDGRPT